MKRRLGIIFKEKCGLLLIYNQDMEWPNPMPTIHLAMTASICHLMLDTVGLASRPTRNTSRYLPTSWISGSDHNKPLFQYCYGSEAQRIDVVMEKDPAQGLGLTLVDGAVNGVKVGRGGGSKKCFCPIKI